MWLLEFPEPPVLQLLSRVNVFTGAKHCWNMRGRTVILTFYYAKTNWVGKHLFYSHLKSLDCLVTRSIPITCILVKLGKIPATPSNAIISKTKNILWNFCWIFTIYIKFITFWKKISFIAYISRKLLTPRNVVTWIPECICFRTLFESQRDHGYQKLMKLARERFHPNFSLSQGKLS